MNILIMMDYAETLIGIPFRWYDADVDSFVHDDKFWVSNSSAPTADEIRENDRSIVCTGFINLIRRKNRLSIPGLNGNISGKYKELYKQFPGGTGAWYLYLYQKKRLEKINLKRQYPKGTLLIARFKDNVKDQGHVAVVYDCDGTDIREQSIIHSYSSIEYKDRHLEKNHGNVRIDKFYISNNENKGNKKSYYTFVCLPENWLLID